MTSIQERIEYAVDRAMPGAKIQELRMGAMRSRWDGEDRDILAGFVVLAESESGLKVCWQGTVRAQFAADGFIQFTADVFWGHYRASADTSWVERCDKIDRV